MFSAQKIVVSSLILLVSWGSLWGQTHFGFPPAASHACGHSACGLHGLQGVEEDADHFVPPPAVFSVGGERSSTFIINYNGFSPEAQAAFDYAVDIWSSLIDSPVAIRIDATWEPLASGALAQAGPNNLHENFQGAAVADIYYAAALANSLNGEDLSPLSDITCSINSEANWYFGTDGSTPSGQFDLVTAVLHEIGHGLGFIGSAYYQNGFGFIGTASTPYIYDTFVQLEDSSAILSLPNGSITLGDALTSDALFWGGFEALELPGAIHPRIFAPNSYSLGASYSHLNESSYPPGSSNALMTPSLNTSEAQHDPGPVMLAMLRDMGWSAEYCAFTQVTPVSQSTCNPETNLFSQTLEFQWQGAPSGGLLSINGTSYLLGTSPRQITLSGLEADGMPQDVSVHFTALPSCSATFENAYVAAAPCYCLTDLSGNGVTDVVDVLEMLMGFGCNSGCSQGDATGDGAVNVEDALAILAAYGQPCD